VRFRVTMLSLGLGLGVLAVRLDAQSAHRYNEPAGLDLLTDASFEGGLPSGWTRRDRDAIEFLPDRTAPHSPPGIARAYFHQGFEGGRGPVRLNWDIEGEHRTLYLSFWMRLSENWVGHRSGVNKIFHLWIDGRNMAYLSAQGAGAGPYAAQVRLQGIAEEPIARNLTPRGDAPRLRRGTWHHWEVVLTANTPGVRDGRVEWWIDGRPAGRAEHIGFVKARGRPYWTQVSWNPTWGGMGGTIPAVQWMDMDHIQVSVGK
jgi:hypothetical protein